MNRKTAQLMDWIGLGAISVKILIELGCPRKRYNFFKVLAYKHKLFERGGTSKIQYDDFE